MISDKVENSSDNNISQNSELNKKENISLEQVSEEVSLMDPRDEKILKLEMELLRLKESERDNVLRLQAELENIRRRTENDIEKAHKFALEHFFIELLPVIDNLERALDMLDRSNHLFTGTVEGIELTLKSLLGAVHKFGLNSIGEVNIPFNPSLHQAMTIIDSKEHEPNCIIAVMQKGYILNGRLIRPAMVTVSK